MSSTSRKRPGSDSFARTPTFDKRPKPGIPRDGSENYVSPRSPETSNYSMGPEMRPPDSVSNLRNGAFNGRESPNSAPPPPVNTDVASTAALARSGSRSSTPQQRTAPFAPMGHMVTPSTPLATSSIRNPSTMLEQVKHFTSALLDVSLAQGDMNLARMKLDVRNTQATDKFRERHAWVKNDGETSASVVDAKEKELKNALAVQETATEVFASVLSTMAQASASNNSAQELKQLLDQKDNDLRQLKNQMAEMSRDLADLRAQNKAPSSNRLKEIDDLRSDFERLRDRQTTYVKRTGDLEGDSKDYMRRTIFLEDDVEKIRKRTKRLEDDVDQDIGRRISNATKSEIQKTVPLEMDTFKEVIRKDLKKMEGDIGTKHKKLEQAVSRQDNQLCEVFKTVKDVEENLKAAEKHIADLSTSISGVQSQVGHFENQISSLNSVPDQVKALEERLGKNTDGGQSSTLESSNEMARLDAHEFAIQAIQKKLHSLDASQLQEFFSAFEDHKADVEGYIEETKQKFEGVVKRLDKTEATVGFLEGRVEWMDKQQQNLAQKVAELYNRIMTQLQSPSPHIANANISAQNGVSLQPAQQEDSAVVRELQTSYVNISQHLNAIVPRIKKVDQEMADLKPRLDQVDHKLEANAVGIQHLDERYNNLTTDEMVRKMVNVGLPQWKSQFPAATNFQAEAEHNRREINGIKNTIQGIEGSLREKDVKIKQAADKAESAVTKVEQVANSVSKIQTETMNSHKELLSAQTRLSGTERDLGTMEPKVLKVEKMLEGNLNSIAEVQHAVKLVNGRLNKPCKLPSWES